MREKDIDISLNAQRVGCFHRRERMTAGVDST